MAKYYYTKYKADLKGDLLATRSYTNETVVGLFNGIYGSGSVDTGSSLGQTLTYYTHSGNFYGISNYTNYTPSVYLSTLYNYYPNKELYFNILRSGLPVPHSVKVTSTNSVEVYIYNTPAKFTRGALVESNIQAEDGTYPANGVHSDGSWYVRGALINTAPTTPGAFTQPTGELEIGDVKTISWGTSSDVDLNFDAYVVECSINGGGWTQISITTSNSAVWKVPTATTVKFRVKARDNAGLESAYRESALFTVTKPKYYWSKYNSVATNNYKTELTVVVPEASRQSQNNDSILELQLYLAGAGISRSLEEGIYRSAVVDSLGNVVLTDYARNFGFFTHAGIYSALTSGSHVGLIGFYVKARNLNEFYYVTMKRNVSSDQWYSISISSVKPVFLNTTYTQGTLVQSGIIAIEETYPINGRHSDGFWYVRGSRVNQSIAPTGGFTAPQTGKVFKPSETATITFAASTAPNIALYEVDYKYGNGTWQTLANNASLSRTLVITTDKSLGNVQFRVRAKNTSNVYSDYVYSELFIIQHNAIPTLTLTTVNNQNITENGTLKITGSALETDNGNVLTVKYSINNGITRNISSQVSTGVAVDFTKDLTMRNGRLYDGATELTGDLTEGTGHILSVWAEDDQGGKSTTQTRTFYVTLNRPVALTINSFQTTSGLINNDNVTVEGDVSDPDGNQITLYYSVNNAEYIEIYNGLDGPFTFNFPVKLLNLGSNEIKVKAVDSYNMETIKTIRMSKEANNVTLTRGENRYKVTPPNGQARGLVLWIERDTTLEVSAYISMVNEGEPENYQEMIWNRTENAGVGILEDEFKFQADAAKTNISLIVDAKGGTGAIHLISGVMAE